MPNFRKLVNETEQNSHFSERVFVICEHGRASVEYVSEFMMRRKRKTPFVGTEICDIGRTKKGLHGQLNIRTCGLNKLLNKNHGS